MYSILFCSMFLCIAALIIIVLEYRETKEFTILNVLFAVVVSIILFITVKIYILIDAVQSLH